jgi:hypothetical protein
MIADVYAVIEVREQGGKPDADVAVAQVLWAADKADEALRSLNLVELPDMDKEHGYRGPGKYLVPLRKARPMPFLIAEIPQLQEKRIYRWTPDSQAQAARFVAAKP